MCIILFQFNTLRSLPQGSSRTALGAQRIPDPTTAGDFTRRFEREDIETLMECINRSRQGVWAEAGKERLEEALIDIGRKIVYRLLGYNAWLKDLFRAWERIRRIAIT